MEPVLILRKFCRSDPVEFSVTHLDLLLRGEAHHDTVEATLWSLDSTAAHKQCPELDKEGGVYDGPQRTKMMARPWHRPNLPHPILFALVLFLIGSSTDNLYMTGKPFFPRIYVS